MSAKPGADQGPVACNATGAVLVTVRVIPRSRQTRIDGVRNNAVLVRLAAAPVDGAANDALLELLADILECSRRQLRLVSGERSRDKSIQVDGIPSEIVARRLLTAP